MPRIEHELNRYHRARSSEQDESELDDTGHSSSDRENDFFDLEASETDGAESNRESVSESDHIEQEYFTQFTRLPIELRRRVWEFFCPDLVAGSHVFHFTLIPRQKTWDVWEGAVLKDQTEPARAILAAHKESRLMALRTFPDTLAIRDGHGQIRFNKNKDIVYLNFNPDRHTYQGLLTGFSENITHLAVDQELHPDDRSSGSHSYNGTFLQFLLSFPNLETVYSCIENWSCKRRHLLWSTSDLVKRFHIQTHEDASGLGEDFQCLFCWPDLDNHRDFAEGEIPLAQLRVKVDGLMDAIKELAISFGEDDLVRLQEIETWPMVRFEFDEGMRAFDELMACNESETFLLSDSGSSASSSGSVSNSSQYESEGIDDAEIDEIESSGEEDDLGVLPLSDGASIVGGLSPLQHESQPGADVDVYADVRFSSPELESEDSELHHDSDDQDADEDSARLGKRPKRRIVLSDSEASSEAEEKTRHSRSANRRMTVVLSDSEEEDDVQAENNDYSTEDGTTSNGGDRSDCANENNSEENRESGKEGNSLMKRLQLFHKEKPVASSESENSSEADASSDGPEAAEYAEFPEDEEREEADSSVEDMTEPTAYGMIMDMAEESDEREA